MGSAKIMYKCIGNQNDLIGLIYNVGNGFFSHKNACKFPTMVFGNVVSQLGLTLIGIGDSSRF
jgi:hypothetical protein